MKISEIVDFLENAYNVLNNKYFGGELSNVVITVQSSPRTYGHYTKYNAWTSNNNGFREINISAESLDRPIENVIGTLIHEMVHHFCDQNDIQDCSRGGTYHNKKFKSECEQRGLIIDFDNRIGFSLTSPSPELIQFISDMGWQGVDLSRKGSKSNGLSGGTETGKKKSSTRKYVCPQCGCSVRATKLVNIGCLDCKVVMVVEEK